MQSSEFAFVQLSDTHIVAESPVSAGYDAAAYLSDAVAAVNALEPEPAFVVVTGDLCHAGSRAEYERFAELAGALRAPYYVLPGNHDNVARLRGALPPRSFGGVERGAFAYAVDAGGVRLIALDSTAPRAFGGSLDDERLDWLAAALADEPSRPTVIALHQPPFRTRMHYVDVLPYPGADRLRAIVERNPQVALLIGGHIHCVRAARWNGTLALSAPSTAPQIVPELFERQVFALRAEAPGFVLYRRGRTGAFEVIVHRRERGGARYLPTERAVSLVRSRTRGASLHS